jgi:hypothetical protein
MPGQRTQGIGRGQCVHVGALQRRAPGEVVEVGKRQMPARGHQPRCARFGQALHHAQAEAQCRCTRPRPVGSAALQHAVPAAHRHVRRQDLHAMPLHVLHDLGR